jgi:hypothetical protein
MDKICGPSNNGAIAAWVAQPLLDEGGGHDVLIDRRA